MELVGYREGQIIFFLVMLIKKFQRLFKNININLNIHGYLKRKYIYFSHYFDAANCKMTYDVTCNCNGSNILFR